jgi:hypothetical protein
MTALLYPEDYAEGDQNDLERFADGFAPPETRRSKKVLRAPERAPAARIDGGRSSVRPPRNAIHRRMRPLRRAAPLTIPHPPTPTASRRP